MLEFARVYKDDPHFSERRCKKLLAKIDQDGDGKIVESEFVVQKDVFAFAVVCVFCVCVFAFVFSCSWYS